MDKKDLKPGQSYNQMKQDESSIGKFVEATTLASLNIKQNNGADAALPPIRTAVEPEDGNTSKAESMKQKLMNIRKELLAESKKGKDTEKSEKDAEKVANSGKEAQGGVVTKAESCEKCGDMHKTEECMKGKSLREMKKSEEMAKADKSLPKGIANSDYLQGSTISLGRSDTSARHREPFTPEKFKQYAETIAAGQTVDHPKGNKHGDGTPVVLHNLQVHPPAPGGHASYFEADSTSNQPVQHDPHGMMNYAKALDMKKSEDDWAHDIVHSGNADKYDGAKNGSNVWKHKTTGDVISTYMGGDTILHTDKSKHRTPKDAIAAHSKMAKSELAKARVDEGKTDEQKKTDRPFRASGKGSGGVHTQYNMNENSTDGNSLAGGLVRENKDGAKAEHQSKLEELKAMPKPQLAKAKSDDGYLPAKKRSLREERAKTGEKGVHIPPEATEEFAGQSVAGNIVRANYPGIEDARNEHSDKLSELKSMKNPKLPKEEKLAASEHGSYNKMKKAEGYKKPTVSSLREQMASDQGVKANPATGKVPNVHQDHATGVKTAIPPGATSPHPPTSAPKAPSNAPKRTFVMGTKFKKSEEEITPDEGDIFFHNTGKLGAKTSVSADGKHLGEFSTEEQAHDHARKWSKKNSYTPNAWSVSDHGNHHLIENFHSEDTKKSEASAIQPKLAKAKDIVKKIKK
jgi:hypothetical protein